jgi:hypothetical protein
VAISRKPPSAHRPSLHLLADFPCFSVYPVVHSFVKYSYHFEYKPPSELFSRVFRSAASTTSINSCTYRPKFQNARKSFVALLLPHLFPVSPLLRYSYKKMGGGGYSEWESTKPQAILEIIPVLGLLHREKFYSFLARFSPRARRCLGVGGMMSMQLSASGSAVRARIHLSGGDTLNLIHCWNQRTWRNAWLGSAVLTGEGQV